MNLTVNDFQIFDGMKDVLGRLNLRIIEEGQVHSYLFYKSRLFGSTPASKNDTLIGYDKSANIIKIVSSPVKPIPEEKKEDLFDLLNSINQKLVNVRFLVDPGSLRIELQGEMILFGNSFNPDNFKEFLQIFLATGKKLFPKIDEFLQGSTRKENIEELINSIIKLRQQEMEDS